MTLLIAGTAAETVTQPLKYVLMCFLHHRFPFLPDSAASSPENKWFVIVDRASLLLIHTLSGLYKVQEQSWRLLELHSLKIVSSGIIWVSLQEVELFLCPVPLIVVTLCDFFPPALRVQELKHEMLFICRFL